ncbi:MAG TPA: DUF192 domain-containing protein [Bdellovibrionota bacterium]|nr:DUF192 domain-containing protein [Bdellovibrionota bacterium]
MYRVRNMTRQMILADRVEQANRLWPRMKGLLGRSNLPEGHGLWISHCNSIHTWFMRFPIDVVFVSSDQRVVRLLEQVSPFRMTRPSLSARSVLELAAGTLARRLTHVGDQLSLEMFS